MSDMAYKALGFVVWKGVKSYLRYRYPVARRVGFGALAATVVAAVAAVALARRGNGSSSS